MVINAEHFLAMRLLLDDPSLPVAPAPAWPGALLPGDYSSTTNHHELALFQRSGRPYLSAGGATGTVHRTQHTEYQGMECWQWDIDWDDGSGTLRSERLWLQVHGDRHFDVYDAQGQCSTYALVAEEIIPQRCTWPEPLYMAVYQATDVTGLPAYLHQLEILEYDDEPLLQCAIGIGMLQAASVHADGVYQASVDWSLRDDAGDVVPPTKIRWRIHDGDRFDWLHADGKATPYAWLRNI